MSSRKRIDPFVGALIGAGVGAAAIGAFFLYRHLTARQVVKATPASSVPLHRLQTTDDISSEWTAPTTADNVESIFRVTTKNGFLPLVKSLRKLPAEFKELDAMMARLPAYLHDAKETALAEAVARLPQYDIPAKLTPLERQCVYRDYAILVSAYLLEGKTKAGKARATVPANVAVPFCALARQLDQQWIMSYDSYCLSNCFSLKDDSTAAAAAGAASAASVGAPAGTVHGDMAAYDPADRRFEWDNLRLVRSFDGGAEEYTFITVHSEIESHTPELIRAYAGILAGLRTGSVPCVTAAVTALRGVLEGVVVSQLKMFNASDPRNYEKWVRPWIFGWKGSEDHPKGVVFEGVQEAPTFLRGETGAQSTIVPSADLVLGITHKGDMLRTFLVELEAYRPKPHREFLKALRTVMWGYDVGAGGAPSEATGPMPAAAPGACPFSGAAAAAAAAPAPAGSPAVEPQPFGPNPLSSPSHPSAGVHVPHALRDFIRLAGDAALAAVFNECVALVWAFRDVHVTFSALYIGRYTNRETATGGTPYKAYLRKHRDESMAHQITDFGEGALKRMYLPSREEYDAEIEAAVRDSTANGIPPHLLKRHADIIARWGQGAESLKRKAFPTGSEFVHHDVEASPAAGAGAAHRK